MTSLPNIRTTYNKNGYDSSYTFTQLRGSDSNWPYLRWRVCRDRRARANNCSGWQYYYFKY
ncbi:hypothetical protein [Frankia sp. AiPa1]|uniref:hypothetical protein n=1 Tax=Frankia sp. AiPa1 TaxID=573492 RepID=UPI00202AD86C|nr:hypothetical protein [Frankia sp. AiPa1]MCL9761665.1 hypothetical protein [Frankia sp. AiPa1]